MLISLYKTARNAFAWAALGCGVWSVKLLLPMKHSARDRPVLLPWVAAGLVVAVVARFLFDRLYRRACAAAEPAARIEHDVLSGP